MTDERLAELGRLEQALSYRFHDIGLLDNALTHSSFVNENPAPALKDNERLEFLGDAVLGLCVSDLLMGSFPDYTEGQLSRLRASVVNEQSLAELARKYALGNYLLLGKGEAGSGGRAKPSLLANAFEALIAALYLDAGYKRAGAFIGDLFAPLIEDGKDASYRDYKTSLQEVCRTRFKAVPRYTPVSEEGPDHEKIFSVRLSVADVVTAGGTGKSKKEAEQQAAKIALAELGKMPSPEEETPGP